MGRVIDAHFLQEGDPSAARIAGLAPEKAEFPGQLLPEEQGDGMAAPFHQKRCYAAPGQVGKEK